jgi:hypothetical protein
MMIGARLLSVLLIVALMGSGVFGPPFVGAQSETQPPNAPPAPGQPDLYQQALRMSPPAEEDYPGAYQTGAAVASAFSVPGRAIICVTGSVFSVLALVVTFGSGYGAAKSIFEEGCIGRWIVTPDDLREANRHPGITPTYTR